MGRDARIKVQWGGGYRPLGVTDHCTTRIYPNYGLEFGFSCGLDLPLHHTHPERLCCRAAFLLHRLLVLCIYLHAQFAHIYIYINVFMYTHIHRATFFLHRLLVLYIYIYMPKLHMYLYLHSKFAHMYIKSMYIYIHPATARYCNTLQHTVTHCNTLQHIAIDCNTHIKSMYIYIHPTTFLLHHLLGLCMYIHIQDLNIYI